MARMLAEKRREQKERERRERHEAWLDTVCETGETNRVRIERQCVEDTAARAHAQEARVKKVLESWSFVLPVLDAQAKPGNFCDNIANGIRSGWAPRDKARDIVSDIYAKAHGRRGSAAYDAAQIEFFTKTQNS